MREKFIFLYILSAAIFFISSNCSFAEEKEQEDVVRLEPIVITPWRVEELAANVSKNVTIVTEEDIERSAAKYVYEVIKDKPGVVVSNLLGNPKGQWIDIRGFGEACTSNVLVLLDGRRTNQIDLSGVDWGQIDIRSIERIEIVRGPATVLYGDNACGGVINIITKKGKTEKPAITISNAIGSHQYHKEFGDVSSATKYADYFFSSSHTQTSGYRANNDYWANDFFGRVSLYPFDKFSVEVSSGYHKDHYGMPGPLYLSGNPDALDPRGIEQIGRTGTVYPDDRGYTSDFYATVEPKFSFRFGDHDIIAKVFGSFRSRRSKGLNVPELSSFITTRQEYETVHHIESYDLRPKLEFDLDFFDSKIINKLTLGTDFFYAEDQVLSGNRLAYQDETVTQKETFGLYLHDNIRLWDRMLMNAGVRGEWADYDFEQKKVLTDRAKKDLKEAAYEVGLGYKYNDISQIYANFSRSYRYPNTEELYQSKTVFWGTVYGGLNEEIKEQIAHIVEIGIKDATFPWVRVNADYYWMDVKNEIYFDSATYKNSNYKPKTIHQGIEIESTFDLFDVFHPYVNYTLQEAYFKGGTYATEVNPLVPKNKISAGVLLTPLLKPLKGLEWSATFNYVSSRFKVSDLNNIAPKLKPYKTFDTKLSYKWKGLRAYFAINNLFDEKYHDYGVTNSTGTREVFYPAPERTFEAGISFTF